MFDEILCLFAPLVWASRLHRGGAMLPLTTPTHVIESRSRLRAQAIAAARQCLARTPGDPEVQDAWRGLFTSEWSLLDVLDDEERRLLIVQRCHPSRSRFDAISSGEFIALVYRAQAFPLKIISHCCRCSQATASAALKSACQKLHLESPVEIAGLFGVGPTPPAAYLASSAGATLDRPVFGQFLHVQPARPDLSKWRSAHFQVDGENLAVLVLDRPAPFQLPGELSRCQREVVSLLLAGNDLAKIAELRKRSRRTVSNQVAAAYRALRVNNRLELALHCRGLAP